MVAFLGIALAVATLTAALCGWRWAAARRLLEDADLALSGKDVVIDGFRAERDAALKDLAHERTVHAATKEAFEAERQGYKAGLDDLRDQLRRASAGADARGRGQAEAAALLRDALKYLEG